MVVMVFRRLGRVFLASFVVMLAGCSGSDLKNVPVGTVVGTITLDGAPVEEGCRIQFASKEGILTGMAIVQDGGEYALLRSGRPEIPAGEYGIQILPPEISEEQEKEEKQKRMAALMEAAMKKTTPVIPPFSQEEVVPLKYWSSATSLLKFTVKEGENVADFALQRKSK